MKMTKLMSRTGAFVIAATAFACLVVMPVTISRDYASDLDNRLAEAVETRARLQSIVATLEGAGDNLTPDRTEQYIGDFLKGEQDSLILAELQSRLRAIVVGKKSELASARTLPAKTIGPQQYLGLRLQIHGEMSDVQSILHSIEYGRPLLFVDRLSLRLLERRGARFDDKPPQLFAEFDVFGAKWPEQSTRQAGAAK